MRYPDYPFQPRRIEIRPGIAMSYLDEGPRDGEVVVMLHGNPSWSYYWRHLVLGLRDPAAGKAYRCIVPDHVGMGLSDKPEDGGGVFPVYLHHVLGDHADTGGDGRYSSLGDGFLDGTERFDSGTNVRELPNRPVCTSAHSGCLVVRST